MVACSAALHVLLTILVFASIALAAPWRMNSTSRVEAELSDLDESEEPGVEFALAEGNSREEWRRSEMLKELSELRQDASGTSLGDGLADLHLAMIGIYDSNVSQRMSADEDCMGGDIWNRFCNYRAPWRAARWSIPPAVFGPRDAHSHVGSVVHLRTTFADSPRSVSVCSGTLVDTNIVLTNSHCIGAPRVIREMLVFVGWVNIALCSSQLSTPHRVTSVLANNKILDYALVQISNPVSSWRVAQLAAEDPLPGHSQTMYQHPGGSSMRYHRGSFRLEDRVIIDRNPKWHRDRVFMGIDSAGGSSGSSVVNSNDEITSIHYAGEKYGGPGQVGTVCFPDSAARSIAVRISELKRDNSAFFGPRTSLRIGIPAVMGTVFYTNSFGRNPGENFAPYYHEAARKNGYEFGVYLGPLCEQRGLHHKFAYLSFYRSAVQFFDATVQQLQALHPRTDTAASRYCDQRGFLGGWLTRHESGNLRGLYCLKQGYGLRFDIDRNAQYYRDFVASRTGNPPDWMIWQLYCREHGAAYCLPNHEESGSLKGFIFIGRSSSASMQGLLDFLNPCAAGGFGLTGTVIGGGTQGGPNAPPDIFPDDELPLAPVGFPCASASVCDSGSCVSGVCCTVQNCLVSDWSPFSTCSCSGQQTRTRRIVTSPGCGGASCPVLSETASCPPPRKDCEASEWSPFSQCTCDGVQTRTRAELAPATCGGDCTLSETASCPPPRKDCEASEWSPFSQCTCDGVQTRTRAELAPAACGGDCTLSETRSCPPPGSDCQVTAWSDFSECGCSRDQARTRSVVSPASCGGAACPALKEVRSCTPKPSVLDGCMVLDKDAQAVHERALELIRSANWRSRTAMEDLYSFIGDQRRVLVLPDADLQRTEERPESCGEAIRVFGRFGGFMNNRFRVFKTRIDFWKQNGRPGCRSQGAGRTVQEMVWNASEEGSVVNDCGTLFLCTGGQICLPSQDLQKMSFQCVSKHAMDDRSEKLIKSTMLSGKDMSLYKSTLTLWQSMNWRSRTGIEDFYEALGMSRLIVPSEEEDMERWFTTRQLSGPQTCAQALNVFRTFANFLNNRFRRFKQVVGTHCG